MRFCDLYIERGSRTRDQMVQAARSGVQNIAEGSQASGTSKKTELKLTNVARSSLEELRLDYEDYLRQRDLVEWPREDPRRQELIDRRPATVEDVSRWVGEIHARRSGRSRQSGQGGLQPPPTTSTLSTSSTSSTESAPTDAECTATTPTLLTYSEIAANAALTLLAVATALLDRQLAAQAAAFEREGGFTERALPRPLRREEGQNMTAFTESVVEEAALGWLGDLGYQVQHGPNIAPGEARDERDDYGQVVLAGRLRDALARLNPGVPASALDEAFRKLTRPDLPSLTRQQSRRP